MRRSLALLLLGILPLLTGCQEYLFRQSDRLTITSPRIYSTTTEPVHLAWSARSFSAPADGRFVVFIDRDPMPPGEGLDYFAARDRDGIVVVDSTTYSIEVLTRRAGVDPAEQDHHDVTVVMLDRQGHRVGEYAGFTEFRVLRGR